MNIETLKKLLQNPHYKLSPKQKVILAKYTRKPMVEFGALNRHNNKKPIHSTGREKMARKKAKPKRKYIRRKK